MWIALKGGSTFFTSAERAIFPAEWAEHFLEIGGAAYIILAAESRSQAVEWLLADSPLIPSRLRDTVRLLTGKYIHSLWET
ncbi:MAG: hypothetical protein NZ571_14050 [Anaerolineae bacterium]|nr:hypothetical protein [Anaerolineae bacterium]